MLCYTAAAGSGFKIPAGVVLKNQFGSFKPKIGKAVLHCNPVEKILPTAVFPIKNPRAHAVCFSITAPQQKQHLVFVANQFGKADLITGQPILLCLPSWKSLTGPPHMKLAQPPGLSHFTCYTVKVQQGAYRIPKGIMLRDQFTKKPVPVRVIPTPIALCLPTQKTIGHHVFPILNPAVHLLCFPVSKTPLKPKVFDQNQFGTAVMHLMQTIAVCVPSTKKIIR
jgi:hypothetical protein